MFSRINPFESLREPGFTRKLTIAFMLVILVVTTIIPVALFAFGKIRSASVEAAKSSQTLEQVGTFQRDIVRMRVKARDFAASGDRADSAEVKTVLNQMTDQLRCIGGKSSQNCEGDNFDSLPPDERERWIALIDRASTITNQLETRIANDQTDGGVQEFDTAINDQVDEPAELLAEKVRERGRSAHKQILVAIVESTSILVIVLVLAVILASALAYWVPRSMMRKLDELRHVAHVIAGGDLTARIDDERLGNDEVADLVMDFNSMAKSLQRRDEENKSLHHQLHMALMSEQERATRDPLTSLRNHRYFQESLAAELDRCSRSKSKVSIAMIDLDNFKQVNDRFGHHEGDAVLLRATQGICDNLRPYDLACRLGGEEFGVIFPETEAEDAKLVLERIAAHIVGMGPNGERLTFSAGITTFPTHSTVQADLYQRADEASYTAKMNGKNQVVIYDPVHVVAMDSEEHKRHRSREAVMTTATTLVSAVDQKDPYTRNHSELTAIYAATIARALQLEEEEVKLVYRAGLLHDVGKIGVADHILKKPGRLDPDEWAQIKMHPELSYRILLTAEMEPIATWVRHHHEHWNGTGYPFRLQGEDIPLGSRIVLIADAFEAMTSDRVYRRALSSRQAVEELVEHAGTQFDPQLVEIMVDLVASGVFDQVRAQYGRVIDPSDSALVVDYVMARKTGRVPTPHPAQHQQEYFTSQAQRHHAQPPVVQPSQVPLQAPAHAAQQPAAHQPPMPQPQMSPGQMPQLLPHDAQALDTTNAAPPPLQKPFYPPQAPVQTDEPLPQYTQAYLQQQRHQELQQGEPTAPPHGSNDPWRPVDSGEDTPPYGHPGQAA